jgi:ribonucleoside-diphosphate reductase alpha chain
MRMHRDASYAIPDDACTDTALLEASRTVWDQAVSHGELHGYRNAQASVLAPTGTISFLMDCDTTGVEPDFSLVKYKTLVGGGSMTIANRTVPLALETLGYSPEEIEQIEAHVATHNTMTAAPGLKAEHMPVFDVAVGENAISYMGHITMMGAVQPFLSGAISKTVNMPAESTVEDIADAYLQAWHLGVKALAIYRDGSKNTQVLGNVDASEAIVDIAEIAAREGLMTPEEVEARVAMAVAEATAQAATTAVAAPVAPAVTMGRTAERRRMPRERQSITHKFSIGGHEGYITCGMYDDGTVGEIFLTDIGKEGSTMRGMMNSFATAISIALQYGVPLETLVQKFAYMRFEPEGITQNPEIPFAKSMPDYIMRWLASRFLDADDQEELGILTPEVRRRKQAQDMGLPYATDTATTTMPAPGVVPPVRLADTSPPASASPTPRRNFAALELGPACGQCGGMMQRTGSCYTCPSCGNNTGCG